MLIRNDYVFGYEKAKWIQGLSDDIALHPDDISHKILIELHRLGQKKTETKRILAFTPNKFNYKKAFIEIYDDDGNIIKKIPMTAADDDWIRAGRLRKQAEQGDMDAAE